jgi:Protein of unknown function (DUF2891)
MSLIPLPSGDIEPFARLAFESVTREYPSHVSHLLRGDADVRPPRELTPAFYGSFDWHSSVHGHWCLARALRCGLAGPPAEKAQAVLADHLTADRISREVEYLSAPERAGFERPYGLAWVLQLASELREWGSVPAGAWLEALRPLETLAAERLSAWLPRLRRPIRSGEHSQSAFAMGLALDWARGKGDAAFERLLVQRALDFHERDRDAPIAYEPSGHDFLSPALGEADLMRRVLSADQFVNWLAGFFPDLEGGAAQQWLAPVETTDRADGKLAHLDGLNLSRAWMLDGVVSVLAPAHAQRATLDHAAGEHRRAGLDAARRSTEYAGSHWLGSFGLYALTRRGIAVEP